MEELLERLVIAVEQQNSAFPWDSAFELVRSTLACVVLRNVGTVPLEVKSLTFNETFTKQLQTKTQERLKKKESTSICGYRFGR